MFQEQGFQYITFRSALAFMLIVIVHYLLEKNHSFLQAQVGETFELGLAGQNERQGTMGGLIIIFRL
jgi:hypothetical protein